MTKVTQALLLGSFALPLVITTRVAAQNAPSGPHPRIWLDPATRTGMQAQVNPTSEPMRRAMTRCAQAHAQPSEYATGGWQGFEFVITLSSCLAVYAGTGGQDALTTAIKYWNVLLDDYQEVGDGQGGDSVVTHDTGYAMRTFAPYSALAYDWLHDAPGVTESLRAHARQRFDAWSTYYSTQGYLRAQPGANYQAGYAFAATLIAIAEGGEAGAAGDQHWANVRDVIWKRDLLPSFGPSGVLEGGDWPEGWQYGPLSVLEHALGARALRDNGVNVDSAAAWASTLPWRFAYGQTPTTEQAFVGGDSDSLTPYRKPANGALLAAIVGPAGNEAKALARQLNTNLSLANENPLFDVLAAATPGPSAPLPATTPTSYLAPGSGNWYVRADWSRASSWAVLQCSPKLVDDHQYANAGNWVLTRGADDLVVDPSPYGSLSTLTGNAPAVDSASLPEGYSPSQGFWGKKTDWRWTRRSGSGLAVARCDYADQFQRSDVKSDVANAWRDFVLIPRADGAASMVLIDRVTTGAAARGLHLRVRTPANLGLQGDMASGAVGSSSLTIRKVWSSSGVGSVRAMPQGTECPSSSHGCDISKLAAGSEYRLDVSGPDALALHVIDTQANASGSSPAAELLDGAGFRGVKVSDGERSVAIVTAKDASARSLSYRVPAAMGAVHVVVDAPVDGDGNSDASAVRDGTDCRVDVSVHQGAGPGLNGRPLVLRVGDDCAVSDDGEQPAPKPADFGPAAMGGAGGGTASASGASPNTGAPALGGNVTGTSGDAAALPRAASSGCTFVALPTARRPSRRVATGGGALAAVLGLRFRRRSRRAPQSRALTAGGR
jgi:hypothetical protein